MRCLVRSALLLISFGSIHNKVKMTNLIFLDITIIRCATVKILTKFMTFIQIELRMIIRIIQTLIMILKDYGEVVMLEAPHIEKLCVMILRLQMEPL